MSSVFLSKKINTTKRSLIAGILQAIEPNIEFVDEESPNLMFRVVSLLEYDFSPTDKILTISDLAIMSMDKYQFNPFNYKKTTKIKNLFLFRKTIAFDPFIESTKKSSLTRNIIQMGGTIVDYNSYANYYLGDSKLSMNRTKKLIDYKWISILMDATKFVDYKHFLLGTSMSPTQSPVSSQNKPMLIIPPSPSKSGVGTLMLSVSSSQSMSCNHSQIANELSQSYEVKSSQQHFDNPHQEMQKLHSNDIPCSPLKNSFKPRAVIDFKLPNSIAKEPNVHNTHIENTEFNSNKSLKIKSDIFKGFQTHIEKGNLTTSSSSDLITQFSQIIESESDVDDVSIESLNSQNEDINQSQDPLMRILCDDN